MPVAPTSMTFWATMSVIGSLRSTRRSWRRAQVYARFSLSTSSGPKLLPLSDRLIGIQSPRPMELYNGYSTKVLTYDTFTRYAWAV